MGKQTVKELKRLTQEIVNNPDDLDLIFSKGQLLLDMGKYSEAEEVFRYLHAEDPDDAVVLANYVESLICKGKTGKAYKLYDKLLSIDFKESDNAYYTLITNLHISYKKTDEAIYLLDKTIEANYDPQGMFLLKALILFDTDQTEQAEYYLNLCVKQLRNNPVALYYAGIAVGLVHPDIALKLYLELDKSLTEEQKEQYGFPLDVFIAEMAYVTENYETYLKYLGIACQTDPETVKLNFAGRMGGLTPSEFYAKELRELGNK